MMAAETHLNYRRNKEDNMNRLLGVLLALALTVTLCACGKKSGTSWQEQYDLGVRYLSEGNYEEAVIAFTAAIEIDPKRPEAYLGLADAHIGAGDLDAARKALEDGLAATDASEIRARLEKQETEGQHRLETSGVLRVPARQSYRSLYDEGIYGTIVYTYDQKGNVLRSESTGYQNEGATVQVTISEFTYEGDMAVSEKRWCEYDGRSVPVETYFQPQQAAPGWLGIINGFFGDNIAVCMDPHPGELRMESGEAGEYVECPREVSNPHMVNDTDWAAAVYTYDEQGYPIYVESYDVAGTLMGTAELVWTEIMLD